MSDAENIKVVEVLFKDVYTGNKMVVCDDIIAPNVVLVDPGAPGFKGGIESFKKREEMYHSAFPNKKVTIEQIFAIGDQVAVVWKVVGVHKGDLPNIPATNKKINITGVTVFNFSNGIITNINQSWDRLGLLEQLGLLTQSQTSQVENLIKTKSLN